MAAKEVATLFVELRGNFANFHAQMAQVDNSFKNLGKSVGRTGKLLSATLSVPLIAIGTAAIAAADSIDDAFDSIRVGTGATGATLENLKGSFETVLTSATQSVGEVGQAIADLNTGLGLTGAPLEALATQVSKLSQITKSDLGSNVKATTEIMNAWQVSGDKQGETLDYLFKTTQATGANFVQLSKDISQNQPILKSLGLGVKESSALFAQLTKAGGSSTDAVSALTFAVSRFAKAGVKDMGAALKTVFEGLKNAPSDTEAAAASLQFFGRTAGPKFAALIRSGKLSLDDFIADIDSSSETIDKAAADTDGLAEAFARMKNQITLALTPIGTPLMEGLTEAMQALAPVLKAVGQAFTFIGPTMTKFIVGLGAIAAAIGPALYGLSFMFGWMAKLSGVIKLVSVALPSLGAGLAFLVSPLGLIALAAAAVAIAFYNWDTIGPVIDDMIDNIKAFGEAIVSDLSDAWNESTLAINNWIDETIGMFQNLKDQVLAKIGELIAGITDYFTNKMQGATDAITGFGDDVVASFQGMYDTIIGHSIVPDMVEGVTQEFSTMAGNITEATKTGAQGVVSAFDSLLTQVSTKVNKAGDAKALVAAWKQAASELKTVMSSITGEIDPMRQKITELLKVGDLGGLQKMADGFRGNKDALDSFRDSLRGGAKDFEEAKKNQEALNERLKETQAELYELSTGKKYIDPLTQSITELMQAGNMDGIRALGESMQDSAENARDFEKALTNSVGAMRDMKQESEELAGSISSGFAGMLKGAGVDSIFGDFFGGILGGSATGGGQGGAGEIGNWLNKELGSSDLFGSLFGGGEGATSFLGDLGPYMSTIQDTFASLQGLSGNRQDIAQTAGQSGGAAIGAVFGGPVGAQIGSSIGKVVGKVVGGFLGGGGPTNKETIARNDFKDALKEMLPKGGFDIFGANGQMQKFTGVDLGSSSRFNQAGWADKSRAELGDSASNTFDTLGKGLTALLGITEDVGGQMGVILAENLNRNLDNARLLIEQLGVSQEDMKNQFNAMGENASMSWHEVEVSLQQIPQLFGEGLVAVGDMAGGFNQIISSAGDGMDAIGGVKNAAVEAAEAGVKSFAEWKQSLLSAGADPSYVDAFFKALDSRGLESLEEIKNASTRTLGGVIADMESNSQALSDQWHAARTAADEYATTISNIPDSSTKNVTFNINANADSDSRKFLDMQGTPEISSSPMQKFAKGGVVNGPMAFAMGGSGLGLMGEAGPEAILPLSRVNGKLGVNVSGGGGGKSNVYNIDARGAAPGVEKDILRALSQIEQRAIESAVNAVADLRDRGGSYSDSF